MSVCHFGVQVYFDFGLLSIFSVLSAVLSDVLEEHVSFLYAKNRRYRKSTDLFYVNQMPNGT